MIENYQGQNKINMAVLLILRFKIYKKPLKQKLNVDLISWRLTATGGVLYRCSVSSDECIQKSE